MECRYLSYIRASRSNSILILDDVTMKHRIMIDNLDLAIVILYRCAGGIVRDGISL